jgi:hypothetical protein
VAIVNKAATVKDFKNGLNNSTMKNIVKIAIAIKK